MRTIIAGSRTITDYQVVCRAIANSGFTITEAVSGTAQGVDQLGEQWAQENSIPIKRFPAAWKIHGRAAGPIRNEEMAKYAQAAVICWDGESRGTASMIQLAHQYGLRVFIDF